MTIVDYIQRLILQKLEFDLGQCPHCNRLVMQAKIPGAPALRWNPAREEVDVMLGVLPELAKRFELAEPAGQPHDCQGPTLSIGGKPLGKPADFSVTWDPLFGESPLYSKFAALVEWGEVMKSSLPAKEVPAPRTLAYPKIRAALAAWLKVWPTEAGGWQVELRFMLDCVAAVQVRQVLQGEEVHTFLPAALEKCSGRRCYEKVSVLLIEARKELLDALRPDCGGEGGGNP